MKRTVILVAITFFVCSTAIAFQGGGGESTKKRPILKKEVPKKKAPVTKPVNTPPTKTPVRIARPVVQKEQEPEEPLSLSVISNLPDVTVKINGNAVGSTDANGKLVIPDLTSGAYTVTLAKTGYQPQTVTLTLALGESQIAKFELKPTTQSLTVASIPAESEVYIDNLFRGRTDASGNLTLTDVPVGEHRIAIRKERYKEKVLSLSLSPDRPEQIKAILDMAVGFLTITTNVPNPSINISGVGNFDRPVRKFECESKTYFVTVSSPLYVSAIKEITIVGGQEAELSIDLTADSEARMRLESEFLGAYSSGQYDQAIAVAKTLLAVDPKHVRALTVIAESHFRKDDFDSFAESAIQAIEAGGSLEFLLQHQHAERAADMHPVRIVVSAETVSFDPQISQIPLGSSCPDPAVTLDRETIVSSELSGNLKNEVYLQLVFANAGNPKKPAILKLADRESLFVKEAKSTVDRGIRYDGKTMNSRQQAYGAMNAISKILNIVQAKIGQKNDSRAVSDKPWTEIPELKAVFSNPETTTPTRPDYVIPNGVLFTGILENEINTKNAQNNDRFRMTVKSPDEFRGAVIEGHISGVHRSGKVTGQSEVTFNFEKITLQKGQSNDFAATLLGLKDQDGKTVKVDNEGTAKGNSQTKEAAKRVGAGAGIGAVIGGILGGAKGAAIGAAVGAGTGAASVKHEDIKLKKGSTITLRSSSPVRRN